MYFFDFDIEKFNKFEKYPFDKEKELKKDSYIYKANENPERGVIYSGVIKTYNNTDLTSNKYLFYI